MVLGLAFLTASISKRLLLTDLYASVRDFRNGLNVNHNAIAILDFADDFHLRSPTNHLFVPFDSAIN